MEELEKMSAMGMTVVPDFEFERFERVWVLMLNEKDLLRSSRGRMLGEEGAFVGELVATELLVFGDLGRGIEVEQGVAGGVWNCHRRSHC